MQANAERYRNEEDEDTETPTHPLTLGPPPRGQIPPVGRFLPLLHPALRNDRSGV
jgi:hypothetical protein